MRTVIIVIGLGLALLGGLWWRHHPAHPAPVNASIYETDMMESLVREILTEFKPPLPSICFLAFGAGTTSPSPEFIARFAGSQPAVRRCGSAVSPPVGRFFETSTGKPGLVVHIIRFKKYIPGTFDVRYRSLTCRPATTGSPTASLRLAASGRSRAVSQLDQ